MPALLSASRRALLATALLACALVTCRGAETAAAAGGAADAPAGGGDHQEAGVDVLAVFTVMLVIGVATQHILSVTRIPYTALLIVWGVWLGLADVTYGAHWKLLGLGTELWQNINPTLLLTGFLPVLLFAAAFGLEWQYIRRLMGSGLLLAGPGVLLGASLTALLVKYTFPYDWSWVECLLFGSVFSATDPVAVVAVLKETGMPKKVRTLVDLEALLNDGTAYVLFVLLRTWAEGKRQTAAQAVKLFFQLTAGGPATGVAFGLAATLWLRTMFNRPMAEISLTLAAAYGAYIVGEQLFGVSGVLAVVFLGLWMAAKGFNHVSRKVEHPLHVFWEELEFIANTIVFLLSGIVIAGRIYESAAGDLNYIQGRDWGYAALLWVYLTLIRVLMLLLAWPALNAWGYVLSAREAVVLCWSGLRGAVGLSLALFILLDPEIGDARFSTLTFFFMGCIAFLTITIQGASMKPLLQLMQLTRPPHASRAFMRSVLQQIEEAGDAKLRQAKADRVLGEPDWAALQRAADLQPPQLARRFSSLLHLSMLTTPAELEARSERLARRLGGPQLCAEQRGRLLLAVRQTYSDFFRDHYVTTGQVFRLRLSADEALDRRDCCLADWASLRSSCRVPAAVCLAQRLTRADGWVAAAAQRLLASYLEDAAVLALAFCHAHQLAAHDLVRYERLDALGEGEEPAPAPGGGADALQLLKRATSEQVLAESRGQVASAYAAIRALRDAFPEVLRGIKTGQLAQEVLVHKEGFISEIGQTGLLDENELEQLLALVEMRLSRLHFAPPRCALATPRQLLGAHPLLAPLPEAELQEVLRAMQVRFLNEGSPLCSAGQRCSRLSVLLRGRALLAPPAPGLPASGSGGWPKDPDAAAEPEVAPAGTLLGVWELLGCGACPLDATAASPCLVATLPHRLPQRLLERHLPMAAAAWQALGAFAAIGSHRPPLQGYSYEQLTAIFRHARLESCAAGEWLQVSAAAMLVCGRLRATHLPAGAGEEGGATLEAPCLLPSQPEVYACLSAVKVLHLPASPGLVAGKGQPAFSRSAAAVLAQSQEPGRRWAPGLGRVSAPPVGVGGEDGEAWEDGEAHGQKQQQEAGSATPDTTLGSDRRRSLAHGLALAGLASRASAPLARDAGAAPDHGLTLSGATGRMLQREWAAFKQRQQAQAAQRQANDEAGQAARPPASEEAAQRRLSARSAPASRPAGEAVSRGGEAGAAPGVEAAAAEADAEAGDDVAELLRRRQAFQRSSLQRTSHGPDAPGRARRSAFLGDHSSELAGEGVQEERQPGEP